MSINIIFTKTFGQLIGDVTSHEDGSYSIENPCVIQLGQGQLGLLPILGTCEETVLTIQPSEALFVLTPIADIRNHYTAEFGGVELIIPKL